MMSHPNEVLAIQPGAGNEHRCGMTLCLWYGTPGRVDRADQHALLKGTPGWLIKRPMTNYPDEVLAIQLGAGVVRGPALVVPGVRL